jgi:hypothetical protein
MRALLGGLVRPRTLIFLDRPGAATPGNAGISPPPSAPCASEILELVELEVRELLSSYEFPGDVELAWSRPGPSSGCSYNCLDRHVEGGLGGARASSSSSHRLRSM